MPLSIKQQIEMRRRQLEFEKNPAPQNLVERALSGTLRGTKKIVSGLEKHGGELLGTEGYAGFGPLNIAAGLAGGVLTYPGALLESVVKNYLEAGAAVAGKELPEKLRPRETITETLLPGASAFVKGPSFETLPGLGLDILMAAGLGKGGGRVHTTDLLEGKTPSRATTTAIGETSEHIGVKGAEPVAQEIKTTQSVAGEQLPIVAEPPSRLAKRAAEEIKAGKRGEFLTEQPLINLEHYNIPPENLSELAKTTKQIMPELEKVTGKPLTHQEVLSAASESDILRKVVSRDETRQVEAQVQKLRQMIVSGDPKATPDIIQQVLTLKAYGADVARRLGALGIETEANVNLLMRNELIRKLDDLGRTTDEIEKALAGVDFSNTKEVTKTYRQFVEPTTKELLREYQYINLLSSPKTHLLNAFTNALQVAGVRPAVRTFAGLIDPVYSKLTGTQRQFYLSGGKAFFRGEISSFRDAVKGAMDALSGVRPIERPDVANLPTGHPLLEKLYVIPRAMEAADVFFRTLMKGGEAEALAHAAQKSGKNLTAELLADIQQQAHRMANRYLFRDLTDPKNKTGQGWVLSKLDKATEGFYHAREVIPGARWIVPFVQTNMGILKQGIEHSPAGLATLAKNPHKVEQLAKAAFGSTVFGGAALLAFDDRTTWAVPSDPKAKKLFYDAGMQPYSIRLTNPATGKDYWVGYSRLGPLAYPIAMAAALKHYTQDNPKAFSNENIKKVSDVLTGIGEFFADQTFLAQIKDLIENNPIQGLAETIPSQLIPLSSLQQWVAQIIDPVFRETDKEFSPKSVVNNLMRRLPFASKIRPARTTSFGFPAERPLPYINPFLPFNVSPADALITPLYRERESQLQINAIYNQLLKEAGIK